MEHGIKLFIANKIAPDSWLNDPKYKWFVDGYSYASVCHRSIPVLAKVSPEELYIALSTILDGATDKGHQIPT